MALFVTFYVKPCQKQFASFQQTEIIFNTQRSVNVFIIFQMIMAKPFEMWDTDHFLTSHSEKKVTVSEISYKGLISY